MASFVRRAMVYLGLVDDEYEDYDYEPEPQVAPAASRTAPRTYAQPEQDLTTGSIRTLPVQEQPTGVGMVTPRPQVRQINPVPATKVHVVAPGSFSDAQEIGDRLKASQPVIVNLQAVDRELSRRMIDFCSGATYALGGSMDRVADHVFLLTPSNVEVSAEEKRRLQERNFRS